MKAISVLAIGILLSGVANAQGEKTINLQATSGTSKYVNINSSSASVDSTSNELDAFIWTNGGGTTTSRCYLWFDLSSLPANATVDSAYLSLFANPNASNGSTGSPTYGSSNAANIYQVTSIWNPGGVSWSAQPSFTATGVVTLPASINTTQDYLGINVSNQVINMASGNNYGFLIEMQQETNPSNSLIFYSPNTTDTTKYPTLFVCYH